MRGAAILAVLIVPCMAAPVPAQSKKSEVVAKLEGHRGGVSAIAYSAKGDRIATGSGNGVVRIWDSRTGELVFRVDEGKHNSARVNSVAFSADGRLPELQFAIDGRCVGRVRSEAAFAAVRGPVWARPGQARSRQWRRAA